MDKKQKTTLALVALAVGAYLVYRWYMNRQANSQGTGQLGSNLNSIAPALIAGSAGPTSGLTYYAGNTTVYSAAPVSQPSAPTAPNTPVTPVTPGGGTAWPVWTNPGAGFTGVTMANGQALTTVQQFTAALANASKPYTSRLTAKRPKS
jgi:hypothetical protein